jgi:hypothetical protein
MATPAARTQVPGLHVIGDKPWPSGVPSGPAYHKRDFGDVRGVGQGSCSVHDVAQAVSDTIARTVLSRGRADDVASYDPAVGLTFTFTRPQQQQQQQQQRKTVTVIDAASFRRLDATVRCSDAPPRLPGAMDVASLQQREALAGAYTDPAAPPSTAGCTPPANTVLAFVQYLVGRACQCVEDVELGPQRQNATECCGDALDAVIAEDVADMAAQSSKQPQPSKPPQPLLVAPYVRAVGNSPAVLTLTNERFTLWIPAGGTSPAASNPPRGHRLAVCPEASNSYDTRRVLLQLRTGNYARAFHRFLVVIFVYYACSRALDIGPAAAPAAAASASAASQTCQENLEALVSGFAAPGLNWWMFNFNFDDDPRPASEVQPSTPATAPATAPATVSDRWAVVEKRVTAIAIAPEQPREPAAGPAAAAAALEASVDIDPPPPMVSGVAPASVARDWSSPPTVSGVVPETPRPTPRVSGVVPTQPSQSRTHENPIWPSLVSTPAVPSPAVDVIPGKLTIPKAQSVFDLTKAEQEAVQKAHNDHVAYVNLHNGTVAAATAAREAGGVQIPWKQRWDEVAKKNAALVEAYKALPLKKAEASTRSSGVRVRRQLQPVKWARISRG